MKFNHLWIAFFLALLNITAAQAKDLQPWDKDRDILSSSRENRPYIGLQGTWQFLTNYNRYYIDGDFSDVWYEEQPSIRQFVNLNNFTGGLFTGYDVISNKKFFYGFETDLSLGKASKKFTSYYDLSEFADEPDGTVPVVIQGQVKTDWDGGTYFRFGRQEHRAMSYVAVGLVYANIDVTAEARDINKLIGKVSGNNLIFGPGVAAGVDVAMTDHVFLRIQSRCRLFIPATENVRESYFIDTKLAKTFGSYDLRFGLGVNF